MKVRVNITNSQKIRRLPFGAKRLIKRSCAAALAYEGFNFSAEINVTFVDDKVIKELNKEFRNIDKATDVLSFPLGENGEYDLNPETNAAMLGDVVISVEHAVSQADTYGHSIKRELAFLTVHSILHLLGYDHVNSDEEDRIMRSKQSAILDSIGLKITNK